MWIRILIRIRNTGYNSMMIFIFHRQGQSKELN
jgi:hypothetical protein